MHAFHKPGAFLDIGCANGHLMECLAQWANESGLNIEVFGVDVSASLVDRARAQHPQWRDRFWVADARDWSPPRRFDFVRTELVYALPGSQRAFVEHVLDRCRHGGRV